ncbi:TTF-type domain-containing protein [Citrus sinensis]|uniref:TTF-type domain-containing protein n=1 Tax=Citrus sinensis TaxID=2711 RepID=A0ACB8NCD1_CITSI|nr:TTF-type domain-containing protein [Citrus sinensis]
MGKSSKIDQYFKRKTLEESSNPLVSENSPISHVNSPNFENQLSKSPRIETSKVDTQLIWDYDVNQQDEIRRAYIMSGPYQPRLPEYPKSGSEKHPRRFQSLWFDSFPSWLEYSPTKDAAFCLPCYLFNAPFAQPKHTAFTVEGFNSWKKVRDGKNCAFLNQVGKHPNSTHKKTERSCEDLMRQSQHLVQVLNRYSFQEITNNRLRLKTTIEVIRYLVFKSSNRGNFIQLLKAFGSNNEKVAEVILDKAPKFASYTSPDIQKEILHVFSMRVKNTIREEIRDAKFVDNNGFLQERFFGLVHVSNTSAATLKDGIHYVLSHHNLNIQNIRGQGCDGASNMRGEWKGLQALILKDCPYAYYIHCLAHRLQLALVAVSHEVVHVHHFFTKLTSIANIVGASCKRHDELKRAQAADIQYMISIDELENTRWSSHFRSVSNLIKMFSATYADAAYEVMTTFEFVFILYVMKEIMAITDILCQALQSKSQDILHAMHQVSSTKALIQKLRDNGWNTLLDQVKVFCETRNIDVPEMDAPYVERQGRARHQEDTFTVADHYRVNIFYAAIDCQLQELNSRFNEHAVDLLFLSFRIGDICQLVEGFYPADFIDAEKINLKNQLEHYEYGVVQYAEFKNLSTICDLSQWLVSTRKAKTFPLIYRIIVLVLTLPVSTATSERSFSVMRIVKTRHRNKMEDEFLTDSLIMYIEREIAEKISIESIINEFRDIKERRVRFLCWGS